MPAVSPASHVCPSSSHCYLPLQEKTAKAVAETKTPQADEEKTAKEIPPKKKAKKEPEADGKAEGKAEGIFMPQAEGKAVELSECTITMIEEDPRKIRQRRSAIASPNAVDLGIRRYSACRIPYSWPYSEYDEEYGILERILLGFVAFSRVVF